MEEQIAKDGLLLETFSKNNIKHLEIAEKFKNDLTIQKFFSEWQEITYLSLDDDTNTYYSYVIFDEVPIGICTISFIDDETCVFSQGYLNEYRGKGYSKRVRNIIIEELFKRGIKVIKAYIKKDNISSIKSVLKTGEELIEVPNTDLIEVKYTSTRKR